MTWLESVDIYFIFYVDRLSAYGTVHYKEHLKWITIKIWYKTLTL